VHIAWGPLPGRRNRLGLYARTRARTRATLAVAGSVSSTADPPRPSPHLRPHRLDYAGSTTSTVKCISGLSFPGVELADDTQVRLVQAGEHDAAGRPVGPTELPRAEHRAVDCDELEVRHAGKANG